MEFLRALCASLGVRKLACAFLAGFQDHACPGSIMMNPRRKQACALVRPWAHTISRVRVPTKQIAHQLVADGNCVVARRGGEQPEAKGPSVG